MEITIHEYDCSIGQANIRPASPEEVDELAGTDRSVTFGPSQAEEVEELREQNRLLESRLAALEAKL